MRIDQALQIIRPGAEWRMVGLDYAGLEWLDQIQSKPTQEEIEEYITLHTYREYRAKAYPPIGDQLDAIWKGGQAYADMLVQVQAVKDQYPKP